jgi:rare lipoprotein A
MNHIIIACHILTASWYGITEDHCDPWKHTVTASGEKFNENGLTAASWKFPINSHVRVTNLRNHKTVIVRINDRGPSKYLYRKGRVLDLTRGAFERIAPLSDGVIPIKMEIV